MAIRLKESQLPKLKKELLVKQNGMCPLCKRNMSGLSHDNVVVDHDHESGYVRAALCRNCNGIEGKIKMLAVRCSSLKGYMNWIIRLANYYHKHREPQTNYIHHTHKTAYEKKALRNKRARDAYHRKKKKGMAVKRKLRKALEMGE